MPECGTGHKMMKTIYQLGGIQQIAELQCGLTLLTLLTFSYIQEEEGGK